MVDNQLNKEIGERLRIVRSIFNEGGKLSADQFGFLLGETPDKILNYELGRTSVPLTLIITLYYRGISPIFLLTGEGEIFANNKAGKEFKDKINKRAEVHPTLISEIKKLKIEPKDFSFKTKVIKVAAGKIKK